MKKTTSIAIMALVCAQAFAQAPTNKLSNSGWGGIGTTAPVLDFQINGSTLYTQYIEPGFRVIGPQGPIVNEGGGGGNAGGGYTPGSNGGKKSVAYGPTSGLLLTNTTTGSTLNDGGILRMSDNHMYLDNYELDGNISIANGSSNMLFHGATKRIFLGGMANTDWRMAKFNLKADGAENGLFVETNGGYGLGVKIANDSKNAIEVVGYTSGLRNFKVTGSGEVFARKYTTTMLNIPDYVFEKDYKLMTFAELKAYIEQNKHLPNIPSASEYTENGVDLGEMNRLLLEKSEEQTLYILQLEERLRKLEEITQQLIQQTQLQGNK